RRWLDVVRRVVSHRKREHEHVTRALGGLREALSAVTGTLARATAEDAASDGELADRIERVKQRLASGSVEELRREVGTLVAAVAGSLEGRAARREEQATMLRERLKKVEIELDEARREGAVDPLTKLANRRVLDATLGHTVDIASVTNRPLSVVFIDVD